MRTSRVLSALAAVAGQSLPLASRFAITPHGGTAAPTAADQGNAL
jgi:hypothetical protein